LLITVHRIPGDKSVMLPFSTPTEGDAIDKNDVILHLQCSERNGNYKLFSKKHKA